MKKWTFLLACLLAAPALYAQCPHYETLMQQARAYWDSGKFEKALDQLAAAREHCPAQGKAIDAQAVAFTQQITRQYRLADSIADVNERAARRAYANDLAYKSQTALQKGDRTTAWRLAEFAHRYVDKDNDNVTQALVNTLYYNDNPAHSPLPWASNLEGHTNGVKCVAFSPDGTLLATGSDDNTAKIWNLQFGKNTLTLEGHNGWVRSVAFSPDGASLATGSFDGTAKIWNLQSGKITQTLEGHNKGVGSVAFSPDGALLATGSYDYTAKIWNLQSGKNTLTLEGHNNEVNSVAFSPDGASLATGANDKTAKIWNLQSGKNTLTLEGHNSLVKSVAFSPDGASLATGSSDSTAKIWNLQSGKIIQTLEGHNSAVNSVSFSPDGASLATTGSYDNTAKIWNLQSGKITQTLEGHNSAVNCVAFSPDGAVLATGAYDNTAKIWNLQTGKITQKLEGHNDGVRSVAFSPDGTLLATGSYDNTTKIWNLQSGKNTQTLQGHNHLVLSVAFSPDGTLLASGSYDKTAKIWNLQSGKITQTLEGHNSDVNCVAFSPDGTLLASGSSDNTAKIWNLQTGKSTQTFEGHNSVVYSLAFSPDGARLATGSLDNTAKIWNLQTGKNTQTLEGHNSLVLSVAFSPDGALLATGLVDKTTKIWNLQSGKITQTLEGHNDEVRSVAFSPDGTLLATGSSDNTAKIWNLQSGKNTLTLEGHNSLVLSVAFSPDGALLATGSYDKTAKIWEITAGGCLGVELGQPYLAGLTLSQLNAYGLDNLLDQRSHNEAQLVASRDVWQIAAFAERYAQNARKSTILERTAPDYARAARLYQAAAEVGRDSAFFARLGMLYSNWAGDILESAWPDTARWYVEQACLLNPDKAACPDLWQRFSEKTDQAFDLQRFLNSEDAVELRAYGDFFFQKEQWTEAQQLYEKAESKQHKAATLQNLFSIAENTEHPFNLQRFLNSEDAVELHTYGDFFFQKELWTEAQQLYEKAETKQHRAATLQNLFSIAENTAQQFDFQRFSISEDAVELHTYGDFFFQKGQWTEAQQLYEKAESKQHKAATLQNLFSIAENTEQPFDFQRFLISEDASELAYHAFFFSRQVDLSKGSKDQIPIFQRIIQIREKELVFDTTASLRLYVAYEYNNLGFNELFAANGKEAELSLRRAIELNPDITYAKSNLAFAFLLQGRIKDAQDQIFKLKAQTLDDRFPTYKDAFLDVLNDLEAAQVPNIDYAKVRQWLEE